MGVSIEIWEPTCDEKDCAARATRRVWQDGEVIGNYCTKDATKTARLAHDSAKKTATASNDDSESPSSPTAVAR